MPPCDGSPPLAGKLWQLDGEGEPSDDDTDYSANRSTDAVRRAAEGGEGGEGTSTASASPGRGGHIGSSELDQGVATVFISMDEINAGLMA